MLVLVRNIRKNILKWEFYESKSCWYTKIYSKGFADNNDRVYVYNLIQDKDYKTNINRLGTEKDYFSEEVETKLLANGIEYEFSKFYNVFCNTKDANLMIEILKNNVKLIEQFVNFMFIRSKFQLDLVNKESIYYSFLGKIDHSSLVILQAKLKMNFLSIIGDNYKLFPLINLSNTLFINNSIGIGIMVNKFKRVSIFVPLNTKVGILISNNSDVINRDLFYIELSANHEASAINKCIAKTEKSIGNAFLFGLTKDEVLKYKNLIKNMNTDYNSTPNDKN